MENKYKITVSEPCSENWDEMTPNENGRFCLSCSKSVIDFTTMLPHEVQHFFIQNQNENICGRFRKSQLDTITIHIPSRVLFTQTHYHKMFLLALFIAMGTTLFSCSDKNGNKQKIDKVEVVEDLSVIQNITVGEISPTNSNSNYRITPPPPSVNHVTFVKPAVKSNTEKVKFVNDKKHSNNKNTKSVRTATSCEQTLVKNDVYEEDNIVYGGAGIEVSPEYPEGIQKFYEFLKTNYKIPRKARKLTEEIQASFIIGRDGTLDNIKLINDVKYGTGEEVIRVLKTSRKWYPGERNGKKITERYQLFITLQKDTLNSTKRKRALSKITSIKLIKEGDGREVK